MENQVAQTSASWLSGGLFQRQIVLQAAPSFGPASANQLLGPTRPWLAFNRSERRDARVALVRTRAARRRIHIDRPALEERRRHLELVIVYSHVQRCAAVPGGADVRLRPSLEQRLHRADVATEAGVVERSAAIVIDRIHRDPRREDRLRELFHIALSRRIEEVGECVIGVDRGFGGARERGEPAEAAQSNEWEPKQAHIGCEARRSRTAHCPLALRVCVARAARSRRCVGGRARLLQRDVGGKHITETGL